MYEQVSLHEHRGGLTPHVWGGVEQAPVAIDIPIGTCGSPVASVVHHHDARVEMTGNLPIVAPIPRFEQRIGPIACALVVHDVPLYEVEGPPPSSAGIGYRPADRHCAAVCGSLREPCPGARGKGGWEN